MSVIITFMFEPAKLQMNCASARGTSILRSDGSVPIWAGSLMGGPGALTPQAMAKGGREVGKERSHQWCYSAGSVDDRTAHRGLVASPEGIIPTISLPLPDLATYGLGW